jgi:hypothetical protein
MKMDCLTFRRQMLEDPSRSDAVLAEHEAGCPSCAAFARSLRADEAKLQAALQVPTPPELAERIQLAVSFGASRARRRTQRWLSIAAAGLLAVAAGTLGWLHFDKPYEGLTLERSVLHHVADEARHLYDPGPADSEDLHAVFERFGAKVSEQVLGQVNFAGICMMRRNRGVHLVMRGEQGPVTVFFMPGEHTERVLPVESERFAGVIEPTEWGSIAVVGERGEPLEPVLQRVRQAVSWPAARISLVSLRDNSGTV